MSETTQAAERLLADLNAQSTEQWIEFRRGGVLPSLDDMDRVRRVSAAGSESARSRGEVNHAND
jgi:hypothetical protein